MCTQFLKKNNWKNKNVIKTAYLKFYIITRRDAGTGQQLEYIFTLGQTTIVHEIENLTEKI